MLRFDRERGVLQALDVRAYPDDTIFLDLADAESIARALEARSVGRWAAPFAAGYGLALTARAWAGRPTDARRGALIQAGELLRVAQPFNVRLAQAIAAGLARADAAELAGEDVEATLLAVVAGDIGRADRAAERCGKLAAGLLDTGDRLLVCGFAGPALAWTLFYACQDDKHLRLDVASAPAGVATGDAVGLAALLGIPAALVDSAALEEGLEEGAFSLLMLEAERIALDGATFVERGVGSHVALARGHGLPCYVLGYGGPDPSAGTAGEVGGDDDTYDLVAPDAISAIITSRGIYRPAMIARHLGDGDAPLDVIPLSLS
jgi:methylthioribose-1-phosphate isomerase